MSSIKACDRAYGTITGTRNLYGAKCGYTLSQGSGFGKLRPTSHWCFLRPHKSMAPVLAITDLVARARRDDSLSLTPMERFLNLIVTGPNQIPFSH